MRGNVWYNTPTVLLTFNQGVWGSNPQWVTISHLLGAEFIGRVCVGTHTRLFLCLEKVQLDRVTDQLRESLAASLGLLAEVRDLVGSKSERNDRVAFRHCYHLAP